MKKHAIAAAVLGSVLCASAFAQQAEEGSWMVRARAVHLDSSNGDSTGLGLSIAQSIIHLHGGVLECDSRPGETRFTFYLPTEIHHA